MTMKINQIVTYLEPDQAIDIINFMEQLKEVLWSAYGEEIIAMQQNDGHDNHRDEKQLSLDFNDQIPF